MAVKIRLKRMGAKKRPFYRVVVADSRAPRDGRFIEEIGYYNPLTEPVTVKVDNERANYWISTGAKPTDTVNRLFKNHGVYENEVKEEQNEEVEAPQVEENEEVKEESAE
ncbi:MAG: 30S ribosomal protein S16 [Tissierellia bacterium]|nr:30S ribosomal protein S16 [Tissierellia bacterium]